LFLIETSKTNLIASMRSSNLSSVQIGQKD